MNVEGFQAFSFAALQVGVDAEQSEKSLTKLNDAIGKVLQDGADAPKEVKQAFDALGISMADVQKHGDDLDWMLATMAEGFADVKTRPRGPPSPRRCSVARGPSCCRWWNKPCRRAAGVRAGSAQRRRGAERRSGESLR